MTAGHPSLKDLIPEFTYLHSLPDEDFAAIFPGHTIPKPDKGWLHDGDLWATVRCATCGEFFDHAQVTRHADGTWTTDIPPCEGTPEPITFELNVPSGRLAVANDLRSLFPCPSDDADLNSPKGLRALTVQQAYYGMAHGFVGNSCPSVYRRGDHFWIGTRLPKGLPAPRPRKAAGICTDLWWYSIADGAEVERRIYKRPEEKPLPNVTYLKVTPGVYGFVHFYGQDRDIDESMSPMAEFSWLRPPDPVINYEARVREARCTPMEFIASNAYAYPTLYGTFGDPEASRARVLDHLVFTIGNGIHWHPEGWPLNECPAHVRKAVADAGLTAYIPKATRAHPGYPWDDEFSLVGKVIKGEVKLDSEWAKLVAQAIEDRINYGLIPYDKDDPAEDLRPAYEAFLKVYPDAGTPGYCPPDSTPIHPIPDTKRSFESPWIKSPWIKSGSEALALALTKGPTP